MKKAILLFAILLSAMNMMAQAYEFETKEKTLDNGTRYVECDTKDYAELNVSSPDIELKMWDFYGENKTPTVKFRLYKLAKGEYENSFGVAKKIRELALSTPKETGKKDNVTINLHLSNGVILRGTHSGTVSLSSVQRPLLERFDSVGVVVAYMSLSFFESSNTPIQVNTKENLQVICQQLRTHDIVKIEVDGVSFDVRGLRSAATFNAMFDALAAKTGKGHLYRSSGTSSSSTSSSSSTPSATAEIGFIGILSDGEILCRLDNLIIKGAKGKEVTILLEFEDVNTEDGVFVIDKKVTPPYDDSKYKSVVLHRNVHDEYSFFPPNGGRFKVYAEFMVESGNKTKIGNGKEMNLLGNTKSKYINIYKKQSGDWSYN